MFNFVILLIFPLELLLDGGSRGLKVNQIILVLGVDPWSFTSNTLLSAGSDFLAKVILFGFAHPDVRCIDNAVTSEESQSFRVIVHPLRTESGVSEGFIDFSEIISNYDLVGRIVVVKIVRLEDSTS